MQKTITINLQYGTGTTGKNLGSSGRDDLHLADTSGLDENCESGSIRGNNYTLTLTLDAPQPSGANKDAASVLQDFVDLEMLH